MSPLKLEIVTAEQLVHSNEVDMVVAPGIEGQLAILPSHAPLMTMLQPGELLIKKDGVETYLAVSGGFLEILEDNVAILADTAERAEEIDIIRAEEAKTRAEKQLSQLGVCPEAAAVEAALRRSLARLKVADRRMRKNRS